jgi:hypothetical protein
MHILATVGLADRDADNAFMFVFRFETSDNCLSVMTILEPYLYSRARWLQFVQNISKGKPDRLSFSQGGGGEGETLIECSEGKIFFTAQPWGPDNNAVMFSFPLHKHGAQLVTQMSEMLKHKFAERWVNVE